MMYHYDTNDIYAVSFKNRHADSIKVVWLQEYDILKENGEAPNLYILGNVIILPSNKPSKIKGKITAGTSTPASTQCS